MPNLTEQNALQPVRRTLRPVGVDKVLAHLSDITTGAPGVTGEDALSVLNRKLDATDLVARGSSTPAPDADTAWLFFRDDLNAYFIKEYDGTTYSYHGPLFEGDAQSRVIFHTATSPPVPVISWNAENSNFNVTSGGWTTDEQNAKWMRVVILAATANTATVSPPIRVGDVPAEDIAYARPADGNFNASVSNVKEALDEVNAFTLGGGTSTPATDSWIQVAEYTDETYSHDPPALAATGSYASRTFTIQTNLTTYSANYQEPLFLEAHARIGLEGVTDTGTIRLRFEALSSAGTAFSPRIFNDVSIEGA